MSNDPQAPLPGAPSPDDVPGGAEQAPSAPQYGVPEYAAPQPAAPQSAAPEYAAPQYSPPPADAAAPQQAPYQQAPYQQAPYQQTEGGYQPPTGGYAGAPQPGGMASQVGQPADLATRFLAKLIDYVILSVVLGIVGSVLVAVLFAAAVGGVYSGFGSKLVFGLLFSAVPLAYFSFMESSRGQTIGKMAMKIQVQGPTGQPPTMEQAIRRNAWTAITILWIVPILGFFAGLLLLAAEIYIAVTINNNVATRQGWHDEFAGGTKVIKIG